MAFAAYRDFAQSCAQQTSAPVKPAAQPPATAPDPAAAAWVVMAVTVAMADAHSVRRAIAACPGCGVLRCTPDLREHCVRLDVQFPCAMQAALMHRVIDCVPSGAFGRLVPWQRHLAVHRLDHRMPSDVHG